MISMGDAREIAARAVRDGMLEAGYAVFAGSDPDERGWPGAVADAILAAYKEAGIVLCVLNPDEYDEMIWLPLDEHPTLSEEPSREEGT